MRRKKATKRENKPDLKYQSLLLSKFINNVMKGGKKSIAQRIVYQALEILSQKGEVKALEIFNKAMENVSPLIEIKSKRVGGANYQVPYEVRGNRKEALAMRWILEATHKRKGHTMAEKLAQELAEAAKGEGEAIKKKENVRRMAEANKAFAHFAR